MSLPDPHALLTEHPLPIRLEVVYYSRFGVVQALAEQIANGARREPQVQAQLLQVEDRPLEELREGEDTQAMVFRRAATINRLNAADALIVGSPSYFGTMSSALKRLFEDCATASVPAEKSRPWRHFMFLNKVGAAFAASGTAHGGNEQTLHSILTMMMHLGMLVVTPGQRAPILENDAAPYGATAISGADGAHLPSPAEQAAARDLGQRVAEITVWLRQGRTEWEKKRPA